MKPSNWKDLTKEQKKELAHELFGSHRGIYIVSQALEYAIDALNKVPDEKREVSNIEDMEILREAIFNYPILVPRYFEEKHDST